MADQGSRKVCLPVETSFISSLPWKRPREGGLVSRKRPKVDSAAVRRSKGVSSTSTAVKRIKKRSLSLPLLPRHCDASLKVQVDQQLDYQTKESPCQPTMTSRLPQFSRMRDDLLFRPAEDAVELNRSEAELGKADLFHSLATLEKEAEEASAALTFSNLWRAEESGLGDEETLGTQVSELQGTGREANEPDTKEPAIDRMDELIFRVSGLFYFASLLTSIGVHSVYPEALACCEPEDADFRVAPAVAIGGISTQSKVKSRGCTGSRLKSVLRREVSRSVSSRLVTSCNKRSTGARDASFHRTSSF